MERESPLYPVGLRLDGRPVVVVGAGEIAARRVVRLIVCGAEVTVVAPVATDMIAKAAEAGRLRWLQRKFEDGDVLGAFAVLVATNDSALNARVATVARAVGALTNRADDEADNDFAVPSLLEIGGTQTAFFGGTAGPVFGQFLRETMKGTVNQELIVRFAEIVAAARSFLSELENAGIDQKTRAKRMRAVVHDGRVLTLLQAHGKEVALKHAMETMRNG